MCHGRVLNRQGVSAGQSNAAGRIPGLSRVPVSRIGAALPGQSVMPVPAVVSTTASRCISPRRCCRAPSTSGDMERWDIPVIDPHGTTPGGPITGNQVVHDRGGRQKIYYIFEGVRSTRIVSGVVASARPTAASH